MNSDEGDEMQECREGHDLFHPYGRRYFWNAVRRAFMYVVPDTLGHFRKRKDDRIPCPSCEWKCEPSDAYCGGCGVHRSTLAAAELAKIREPPPLTAPPPRV